ncbi:MAG: IclR family transcriptional regulator [Terriglobia bacterium]|jgi:DNA-binding IclR family transcriptional regulator
MMTNRPAYNRARYEVGSVRKALSILCLFTPARPALNVTDVSRLLNVPKSTAHNLLRTLEHFDFVSQDPMSKHYRLGRKLFELGTLYSRGNDLLTCALPHLLRLREKTHETVKLGVLANTEVLVVKALESPLVLHTRGDEGRLAPLYCTGIGKALLALLPNEELRDILAKVGLRSFTPRTVTSLSKLEEEVEQVRKQGYSVDWEENEEGVHCVGAPVWDTGSERVAISVAGPATRFGTRRIPELAALVVETARAISAALGSAAIAEESA